MTWWWWHMMQMTQKVSFHKLFFKDLSNGQIWLKRGWTESRCDFIEQIWAKEHPCFRFHIQYRIHSNFGINYLHHSTLKKQPWSLRSNEYTLLLESLYWYLLKDTQWSVERKILLDMFLLAEKFFFLPSHFMDDPSNSEDEDNSYALWMRNKQNAVLGKRYDLLWHSPVCFHIVCCLKVKQCWT